MGDSVYPSTELSDFPTLLDFDPPRIRAYPVETVVAEKFQTMVELGLRNSRLKDYYDIYYLSQKFSFRGVNLHEALELTFQRRKTPRPSTPPSGLTAAFSAVPQKQTQWKAFIHKNRVNAPSDLAEIIHRIEVFVLPVLFDPTTIDKEWSPEQGWHLSS